MVKNQEQSDFGGATEASRSDQSLPLPLSSELKNLLTENLQLTREIHALTKKINHWIVWQRVWLVFKIIIIVVPLILGILYLPALLQDIFGPYQKLLDSGSNGNQQDLIQQLLNQTDGG